MDLDFISVHKNPQKKRELAQYPAILTEQAWSLIHIDILQPTSYDLNEFQSSLLQGFGVTWCRTMGLMCTYFILLDSGRRHFPELFKRPILGPFLSSGLAATYPLVLLHSSFFLGFLTYFGNVLHRKRNVLVHILYVLIYSAKDFKSFVEKVVVIHHGEEIV